MNREEQVAVFQQLMNQPFGDNPKEVPLKMRQLAIKLIFSELEELAEASDVRQTFRDLCQDYFTKDPIKADGDEVDEVAQLDGCADVQYTLSWAINMFGHSKYFPEAYDEVCRSNNSKACKTEEEAEATKAYWENPENKEGGGEHFIEPINVEGKTYFVVKRTSDNKVRKARDYSKANFSQFLSQQGDAYYKG